MVTPPFSPPRNTILAQAQPSLGLLQVRVSCVTLAASAWLQHADAEPGVAYYIHNPNSEAVEAGT